MTMDMRMTSRRKGFTLIELMLVIAIIGLLSTVALYAQRRTQQKSRDVQRVSNVAELQKALALHAAAQGSYPVMNGCIDASDAVTTLLIGGGYITAEAHLVDPLAPSDIAQCYRYEGTGSAYTLTYTLETDSLQGLSAGDHTIIP
jgi:prepilin-type N-terminal cleavage/methylation domain-containing protein